MRSAPFTQEEVIAIKRALIRGTHATAIAIQYGVGAESIRRIKRGETHNTVRVAGEEKLRTFNVMPLERAVGMPVVSDVTKEEQDEIEADLLRHQEMVNKRKANGESTLGGLPERPEGVSDQMWDMIVEEHKKKVGHFFVTK